MLEVSGRAAMAAALPFVSYDADAETIDLWAPPRGNDYARDCQTGRQLADAILAYMAATESLSLLGGVVRQMVAKGEYKGVEIGFITRLAMAAYVGSNS